MLASLCINLMPSQTLRNSLKYLKNLTAEWLWRRLLFKEHVRLMARDEIGVNLAATETAGVTK